MPTCTKNTGDSQPVKSKKPSYSVQACKDPEMLRQGLLFEVLNDTPNHNNLNECVALCYNKQSADAIAAALS
jgi:hypothetical protein